MICNLHFLNINKKYGKIIDTFQQAVAKFQNPTIQKLILHTAQIRTLYNNDIIN